MTEIQDLLKIAIRAVVAGGKKIMTVYENFDGQVEYKADNSPLTIADKKADLAIKNILESTNIPILSEEGKNIPYEKRKDWDYFWLVDPLDGTKEFIKRNDEFTVNIALIHHDTPVAGVVLLPVKKELYLANVTIKSAFFCKLETLDKTPTIDYIYENAEKLPITRNDDTYRVVGSRSHMNDETLAFINDLRKQHSKVEVVSAGSSLKICYVAHGKADIYPRFGPTMEWDTAAGHAIVLGAGKQIVKPDNSPVIYNKEDLHNPYFIVKGTSIN